ncbi:tail fiber domain-containing protein [Dyadobacter jiangsuensis]|uniref:tail fiber domain-containing protein n=1 Tax=Dyadobacter fermentans TaxID=94254 RepID=UPI001CC118FC|nr:tail fiber domain-containing protein [Dyadobacter fermentans]MBZ1358190.1 tail fiber domain-containing protein [Dyadobacter fermentans]
MKKWYRAAAALMVGTYAITQVNAQTHYGVGAGTQGTAHAFFGTNAGMVNIGSNNSFLGHEAGASNVDGAANTFVGSFAGYNTIDGNSNVFIGDGAGLGNVSGNMNTYIGADAGLLNKDGGGNVAIGHQAQYFGKTGLGNCSIGYHAGRMAIGDHNVLLGSEAGDTNAGSNNTFLGYRAGYLAGIGELNTFVGSETGVNNTVGHHNTFFGERSGYNNKEGFSNTFLGSESGYSNQTGVANVFLGNKSGYSNTNGHSNVFLGYGVGYQNTTGQRNTYLGYGATGSPTIENATAIGSEAKVTANNSIVLGNKANVGIGVSAPTFQLHLSTDAAAKAGSPTWTVASDSRLKKNITDFTDGLDLLKQIKPVWFQYNGQAGIETDERKFVGIIAQEMQKIAPYTIGTFAYQDSLGNKTEYLDYDANAVTYILINSVKEQQQVIEQKDVELKEMNAQVTDLSKRLEQLERIVASNTAKPLNGSAARMEPNANGVVLEQNVPNGFSGSSAIKYFIPQSVKEARVDVYAVNGMKMNSYRVKERGEGQLTISAGDFQNGVFLYDLVTDGKSNGVKKMVVQK